MLHGYLGHRKVGRISCGQPSANAESCGGDKAVSLMQGYPRFRELSPPGSRPDAFLDPDRRKSQTPEQTPAREFLVSAKAAPNFLNEMAQTQGSSPCRRSFRTRSIAGRPRSRSMRTVESSRIRANRSIRPGDHRPIVDSGPTRPGPHPIRVLGPKSPRSLPRCRPNVARLRALAGPTRPQMRFDALCRLGDQVRSRAQRNECGSRGSLPTMKTYETRQDRA